MTTIDSSTLHNRFVTGSQENLQEKETGANSMPTQAPDGEPQKDIVQSSPEEFDADAEVETITVKITYTKKQLFYKLLDNTLKHIINDTDEQDIIFRFLGVDKLMYKGQDFYDPNINTTKVEIISN